MVTSRCLTTDKLHKLLARFRSIEGTSEVASGSDGMFFFACAAGLFNYAAGFSA